MGHVMLFPMVNVMYCCISTVQSMRAVPVVLNFLLLWYVA